MKYLYIWICYITAPNYKPQYYAVCQANRLTNMLGSDTARLEYLTSEEIGQLMGGN